MELANATKSDHNMLMAKKKPAEKYRKPTRWARIRERLAKQMDILVNRHASDFTEEVNIAVREYLVRAGLWSVSGDDDK